MNLVQDEFGIIHANTVFAQKKTDPIEKAIQRSEKIINKLIDKQFIPGMAVTVLKDSNVIWQGGYGFADVARQIPVDPQKTLFRIASVSKPVAATGLIKMVADSLMDLNASLYKYVPYFPEKTYDFTIKQLGNHTAGIRAYKGKEFMSNVPLSIEEGIKFFKDDPLLFKPGTDYLYSSFNWNLIALAMQEAAEMPFETYIREKVLVPLQMHHTIAETRDSIPGKAVFYSRRRRKGLHPTFPVNNYYKLASGGYLSTASDIARLGRTWLEGRFIPGSIAPQFITSHKIDERAIWYGIGWEISFDHKNRPFYGHTGNGIGAYALFRIYPAQHMVFVMLMNVTRPQIDEELHRIIDHIMDGAYEAQK